MLPDEAGIVPTLQGSLVINYCKQGIPGTEKLMNKWIKRVKATDILDRQKLVFINAYRNSKGSDPSVKLQLLTLTGKRAPLPREKNHIFSFSVLLLLQHSSLMTAVSFTNTGFQIFFFQNRSILMHS